jgi:hypothetical protein
MATQNLTMVPPRESYFSWSSIFAGTFIFLAIEVTFGLLGAAIFASASNPAQARPVSGGVSAGLWIWMVILSIIACYFGGKTAGRLSGAVDSNGGMYQGLVVFGMAIFTSLLVMALSLGSTVHNGAVNSANYSARTVADIVAKGGYWLFVTLVLSMIAAGIGGAHGARGKVGFLPERRAAEDTRRVA